MTDLKQHFSQRSATNLLASRATSAGSCSCGVLAGSLLIGGGQVLSALIRTGAVGGRQNGRQ